MPLKILEKLKAIGIHLPKLKDITGIKFTSLINIDRSIKITGSTVIIDPEKLSGKQKRALKQVIRTEVLDSAGAILSEDTTERVDEVLEVLPCIEETSKKFVAIIPSGDIPLLHACLFLRKRFESGECVEELKGQILRVYGTRGGNFANLCSAGYLEEWFWPLYEELVRAHPDDAPTAKVIFQLHYKAIVNELPWTEFVSARVPAAKVAAHIVAKMKRNIENGVRYLNVHGLGEGNVKRILSMLPGIREQTGAETVRVDQDPNRIFVRLEIPPQRLPERAE
jgi:hypothetical protein